MPRNAMVRAGLIPAVALLIATGDAHAQVVLSEIMYHPGAGASYEYVEVLNAGASDADLAGWSLRGGVDYVLPAGTVVPPGGRVVVCRSRAAMRAAYPSVPEAILLGDWVGALANEGEVLVLMNATGSPVESLRYDDDPPWDFLADGFGASLERLCPTAAATLPENWRASGTPASPDLPGGTPGSPPAETICPPVSPSRPRVFVSEIMYHPVLEDWYEDEHEFVEIHNAEPIEQDIAGWRLAGAIDYAFPAEASLPAGGYAVVAKRKSRLAAVASYGLTVEDIFGDYARTLDNGGEKVALISADGQGIDSVSYDDDFPWPTAADGLGAGEAWLPPALLPLSAHRYRGHSLERVSFDVPSGEVANWAPSPLDGATPGRPNASLRSAPLPIVAAILVQPWGREDTLIRSTDQAWVQAAFSPSAPTGAVDLECFVDDVAVTGEAISRVTLTDDGAGADIIPGDRTYSALLPARAQNSIVRYRIRADLGSGVEVVSPRPTDPPQWHGYLVSPVIGTATPIYHVFISPSNWGQMWRNIEGGRTSGCQPSAGWDAKVPAVLAYNGRIYDALVRYHGSRYNRTNGPDITNWPHPRPDYGPLRGLSWRIGLPRYAQIDGDDVIILNKLTQSCPGYTSSVGYRLYAMADLPSPQTRYARLHVNGGYYRYMIQYERPGESMLRRYHAEQAERYPERPREDVGDLFKSAGCNCDEGPWGWGDERALGAYCGHTAAVRYAYTYERKTHDWNVQDELIRVIEDLNAARRSLPSTAALRSFFEERFDLDLLLDYLAIMNWSVPFDDMFQNHYLYQRLSDGKWIVTPWDLDLDFGGWKGAGASIYIGEQGDVDNRSGWWNYLKDGFLKAYRPEFEARLLELTNTLLHPDEIARIVDEEAARANPAEASQAASAASCGFSTSGFKSFAVQRHAVINDLLSSVFVDAGPDQTVMAGAIVQFDARASRPDPGPDVTYTWSNGMTGDFPTYVFRDSGAQTITLTVTVTGIPYTDSITITVVPAPESAFAEAGGRVVLEAEHFYLNDRHGAAATSWVEDTTAAGFSGDGYMHAKYTTYEKFSTNYASSAPELRYAVRFETTGTYRVWVRGLSTTSDADSCHVGLDGQARDESFAHRFRIGSTFEWEGDTREQGAQTVDVMTPGVHFLSIWVREAGQIVDKVLLDRNSAYIPTGTGPGESEQVPISTVTPFIRGDANDDGQLDISDALRVLIHLFGGSAVVSCEDHGDADDNGALEVTDAVGILEFLFRAGPAPSAPYPQPGYDTTPDEIACGDEP